MAGELQQFQGFADNGQGKNLEGAITEAHDYAIKTADVQLKKQELDTQNKRLDMTMQQHKIGMGMKLIGDWDDVVKTLPGPLQNAKIKKLQAGYATLGMAWDPIMEGMARDDNGRQEIIKARANLDSISNPNLKGALALQTYQAFGSGEGDKVIKQFNDNAETLKKIHAEGTEARTTQAAKVALEMFFKEREFAEHDRKWVSEQKKELGDSPEMKSYSESRAAVRTILDAAQKPGKFKDFATIEKFVKEMNPGAIVRNSTYDIVQDTNSLPGRVGTAINKMWTGQPLTADLRAELFRAAKAVMITNKNNYDKRAQPFRDEAAKSKFDPMDVDPAKAFLKEDESFMKGHEKRTGKQAEIEAANPPPPQAPQLSAGIMMRLKQQILAGKTRKQIEDALGTTIHPDTWKAAGGK